MDSTQFERLMTVLENIAFSVEFARHDIVRIEESIDLMSTDIHKMKKRLEQTMHVKTQHRSVSVDDYDGTAVLEDEEGVETCQTQETSSSVI